MLSLFCYLDYYVKILVDKINFVRYYENVEITQSTKIQFIDKGGN